VRVFSGVTREPVAGPLGSITPYPGFHGGVYVAAGDVDGDGRDDVITGAGAGGGPHVKAYSGVDGSLIASFFAFHAGFTGGVRVGAGDVDRDGRLEIIAGAGPGGGPHVRAFSVGGGEVAGFFAFDLVFTGGVFVAGAGGGAGSTVDPETQPETGLLAAGAWQPAAAEAETVSAKEEVVPAGPASASSRELFFSASEVADPWLSSVDDAAEEWAEVGLADLELAWVELHGPQPLAMERVARGGVSLEPAGAV
jgi:hypothetical protein